MLVILVSLTLAMLWSGQDSASGRALRRWLVEAPAALLLRLNRWQVGALVVAMLALAAALAAFDGNAEGLRLAGSSIAEGAGWFIAFDVGTWIEAYAAILLLGMTRQGRAFVAQARTLAAAAIRRLRRVGGAGRRRAPKGPRRPRSRPPAEPDGWPGLAPARWRPAGPAVA